MMFLSQSNEPTCRSCPSPETLDAFLRMSLSEDERSRIGAHIEHCQSCQTQLDTLTSSSLLPCGLDTAGLYDTETVRQLVVRICQDFGVGSVLPNASPAIELGRPTTAGVLGTLNQYVIRRELGTGATATVYEALDSQTGQLVALKLIRAVDEDTLRRARREAEVIARANHDGIVAVRSIDVTSDGRYCLVMPLVDGIALSRLIQDEEPLTFDRIAEIIWQVAKALDTVHKLGLVHRDVKPSNILIDRDGNPKLTDFGAVTFLDEESSLTISGAAVGTPCYMSPEQAAAEKKLDARSDVYSLGATLYECLTKRRLFHGSTLEVIRQVLRSDPISPRQIEPGIPWALAAICLKAISKDRTCRYQSADEMARDLNRWRTSGRIEARPLNAFDQAFVWCRRNPLIATLVGCLTLSILLGLIGIVWSWRIALNQRDLAMESLRNNRRAIDQFYLKIGSSFSKLDQPGLQPLRRELLSEAVEFYREFLDKWPSDPSLQEEMASALTSLAEVTESLGNANDTLAAWRDAEKATALLEKNQPHDQQYKIKLFQCRFHLANGLTADNQLDEAISVYQQVRATLEAFHAAHPDELRYRRDLASCEGSIGNCLLRKGMPLEAANCYRRAADVFQQLQAEDEQNIDLKMKLATAYSNLSICVEADEQIMVLGKARVLLTDVFAARPLPLDARRLAKVDLQRGLALCSTGRNSEAIESWRGAIEFLKPHVQANPDLIDLRDILAQLYFELGAKLESPNDRLKALLTAKEEQEWICRANPKSAHYANLLKRTLDAIGAETVTADESRRSAVP